MLLQVDGTLECLVAVLALEHLGIVHVLLVLTQSLLAVELLVAHVAVVSLMLPLMPQHVLVETVPVLHLLAAYRTGDTWRWCLHVIDLVRQEGVFRFEGLCADLAHVRITGSLVHCPDVHVQGALLCVTAME